MRHILEFTVFILILARSLAAQQAPKGQPRIVGIEARLEEDELVAKLQVEDLFSTKIVNTIRSGLPVIIRCEFRIVTIAGAEATRTMRSVQVAHDLWAQRFQITFPDTVLFARTFEEMEASCSRFKLRRLAHVAALNRTASYILRARVSVIPISAQQGERLREHLESLDLEEEGAASESGRSGFSLNVTRLLTFFLGGKERPHGTSEWAKSEPFNLR